MKNNITNATELFVASRYQTKWVVTNGYRWVGIFRFKSDAQAALANLKNHEFLKAEEFWIEKGSR